jgi:AcrR family transcriptional regulator
MYTLLTFDVSSVNTVLRWGVGRAKSKGDRSYHHGNLSEALVKAALQLIEADELGKLSLRAVARHAGVSAAAPYRHFESREALLAAIATQGLRMRTEAMQSALAVCGDDPMARLLEVGVAFVLFAHEHPAHYAVMTSPELIDDSDYPELAAAGAESMGILMQAIRDGQQAGGIAAGEVRELAAAAWASVHGLASLLATGQLRHLRFDDEDVEDLTRRITGAMLGAMSR